MTQELEAHTYRKLEYFIRQIDAVGRGDFPHSDGSEALSLLRQKTQQLKSTLNALPKPPSSSHTTLSACHRAYRFIVDATPVLGFILRSTNVRNPFEIFTPLKVLCTAILGPDARLILSSEWDYSPLTYPMNVPYLPNFVLIGLPASESENALIIPLAGHEIGHSVWEKFHLRHIFAPLIQQHVRDFLVANWTRYQTAFGAIDVSQIDSDIWAYNRRAAAEKYGIRKCEELFCDVFGARLFGESFLSAFEYLLAPYHMSSRSTEYPTPRTRVRLTAVAMDRFGYRVKRDYQTNFYPDPPPPKDMGHALIIDAADESVERSFDEIVKQVTAIASKASVPMIPDADVSKIRDAYSLGVPADGEISINSAICAGWQVYDDPAWRSCISAEQRIDYLNELVLKTIEVSEFRSKVSL